jgi:hypothetical protein
MITLGEINRLSGDQVGTFDVPCPCCGPERRSPINRRRRVLRIWRIELGFATFHCARCGEDGHTRDQSAPRPDPTVLQRARVEAAQRERIASEQQLSKARWLWWGRQPIGGSIAETYLREVRGYRGPLPATLGFLPARGDHGPAMIAAFGLPNEPEPGQLAIVVDAVRGVHITRLAPDGSGKAGTDADKITVGRSVGSPIVLAPANDLLGLAITEGIEDALSVHQVTGLGAWAAGSASRLPALASAIPEYSEVLTIFAHADTAGRHGARELADAFVARGIEVRIDGLS